MDAHAACCAQFPVSGNRFSSYPRCAPNDPSARMEQCMFFLKFILHWSCRIWCISLQINLSRAVGSEIVFLIHVRTLRICAFVPLGSFPLSTHGHRHFQIYPDMFSSAMAGALWAFLRNQDTTALEQFYIRCA